MDFRFNRGGSLDSAPEPGLATGLAAAGQEDDYDDDVNNTLYELTDLQEYTARKVEADDIRAIRNLLKDDDYSHFRFEDPVLLYETCCFSLAVFDVIESDRLVAAAFFDDKPANPYLMKLAKKWKSSHDLKSMAPINTLHLRCFVCNPEVAEDVCLTEIISHTFSASIHIDYIVVEMPSLDFTGAYAFSSLVKELEIPTGHREKTKIVVYKKDLLMPHLLVREGREHDLDDLTPLLPLDTPLMEQHFGKSKLSDVIAMSEKGNQSMVAEWKGEATGVISVSADLDYELLNDSYHLEPFHGLHKPHKNDQIYVDQEPVRNTMHEVDFDELFTEVEKCFQMRQDQMRQVRIRRQDGARQPYDIECVKEFSMTDVIIGLSDDDNSGVESLLDDKSSRPNLFASNISEEALLHELNRQLTAEDEGKSMSNLKPVGSISENPTASSLNYLLEEEEDEVEDDEEYEDSISLPFSGINSEHVTSASAKGKRKKKDDDEDKDETEDSSTSSSLTGSGGSKTEHVASASLKDIDGEEDEDEMDEDEENEDENNSVGSGNKNEHVTSASTKAAPPEGEDEKGNAEDITSVALSESKGEKETSAPGEGEETTEGISSATVPGNKTEHETSASEGMPGGAGGGNKATTDVNDDKNSAKSSFEESEGENEHATHAAAKVLRGRYEDEEEMEDDEEDEENSYSVPAPTNVAHGGRAGEVGTEDEEENEENGKGLSAPDGKVEQVTSASKNLLGAWADENEEMEEDEEYESRIAGRDVQTAAELDFVDESGRKSTLEVLPGESGASDSKDVKRRSVFHGIANALAVKMFNMNKKHMLRHMDLFREIFKPFPNREYLVITIPIGGNVREPSWLQNFVRVIPRVESSYPRDLFVIHKVAITAKVRVRKAKERDIKNVKSFLSSLLDKNKIYDDFIQSFNKPNPNIMFVSRSSKMSCYVAEVKNYEGTPIIGLAMVSAETNVLKYAVNYDLERHTYFAAHDVNSAHGYVHHMIINPLFQRHSKLFLKEVMRLDGKQCLFHRVYPDYINNDTVKHQSILNDMEDWIPLMPRKRIHYEDLGLTDVYDDERQPSQYIQDMSDPYALIHTGKKFILEPKITLTKRLVFVGAGTTSISCLEKLISSTYRSFKYLTVIDPFGLPGTLPYDPVRNEFFALRNGGAKMSYESDAEWVQRTGIHLWVEVVIGRVTRIVRDSKYVVVNSDNVVPYDKLVLAPGQQFQRLDCPEPEIDDPNFTAFKKNTATLVQQDSNKLQFSRDTPKPINAFTINNEVEANIALEFMKKYRPLMKKKKVLIFGGGLPTFSCVKALLAAGIPAESIVLITTPEKDVEWETRSGYILSNKVRVPMRQELLILGVSIVENYEFSHWETCSPSGLVKRTHFKSMTERDAHISFPTFALFCYRYRRVDDGIVSALSEAYLLYLDGIVIDAGFRTNDPNIYAAGPAATYQKILLSDNQNHIYYQSEEIGHKLADFLIESSGAEADGKVKLADFNVIKFKKPLIRAVKLLSGWNYLYLRSPGDHSRCTNFHGTASCEESCECTTEVVTGSINSAEDPQQKFFKLRLDDRQRIVSLECMSKSNFSFSNMSALYGQHETLLNKMMDRLESGETTCLYQHFQQSWFSLFCIDEWDNFQYELKDLYKKHDIGSGVKLVEFIRDFIVSLDNPEALQMDPNIIRTVWRSSGLKDIVEEKLLNLLKFHRFSLPMYATHNYVEDLLEERCSSTLYHPNTKAHMVQ